MGIHDIVEGCDTELLLISSTK